VKLGLGTAQFGFDYGLTNEAGQVPREEVRAILALGQEGVVSFVETASEYGDSESVLGEALPRDHQFEIITKTPVFRGRAIGPREADLLERTLHTSLAHLRQEKLCGLLIHHVEDLLSEGGELLYRRMQELKARGLVQNIGVSVYSGQQVDRVLERFDVDIVQVPLNVFDQRLVSSGHLGLMRDAGIHIHARSILLQGLLLMAPHELPAEFESIRPHVIRYHDALNAKGLAPLDGAIQFIRNIEEVECAIFGVCSTQQLNSILDSFILPDVPSIEFAPYAMTDENVINPINWRAA